MKSKINIFLILVLILAGNAGFAQKKEMAAADSLFRDLQFNSAAENYEKAVKKMKETSAEKQFCIFRIAECYRMMNDPDLAEPYYRQLVEANYGDTTPVVYLRFAGILKTKGDVEAAKNYFTKYLQLDPASTEALTGLKSCEWLLANQDKKAQVVVEEIKAINSPDDEFGPAYLDPSFQTLVFTSNRVTADAKNIDQWTGSTFSDLYTSTFTGKGWNEPSLIENAGLLNSDIHEGTPSLNGDFSVLYYTRCGKVAETKAFCEIWKTSKSGGKWGKPELVLFDSTANVGHPSISKDELTLLFSSNKDGGAGGKDIWMARRASKEDAFSTPVPLGNMINTAGDELFPYLYNDTTLLFASDGLEGYGGLDIYISHYRKNNWTKPQNLLTPINSTYDDFGIILQKPVEEGCFCSNRSGGTGGDDIYRFYRKILMFTASGHVKDNNTLLSIKGVKVTLVSDIGDSTTVLTDKQGVFRFDEKLVLEDHIYELIFKMDGYFSKKEEITTFPYEENHEFTVDITLEPIPEKPIVLPDILYELDKWDLAPQYQDSLMQLVRLLKDNESLVIELRSHTDSRGSSEYNDVLSQKRAQSVVDFIVSQGIDPGRLVAKGYGERISRVLDKDVLRENYLFKAGTELNDEFVNKLPSKEIREAAYQLNRRTEFAVIAKDYKPGSHPSSGTTTIEVVSDSARNAIGYIMTADGKMQVTVYINDYSADALIDWQVVVSEIDERIILDLLQKGAIDRTDFEGNFEEILVNDHIVPNTIVMLEKIRLGELVVNDTRVKVVTGSGPYLIIGKDILDKAGPFMLDEEQKKLIFK